jgi:hypothetical protein
MSTLYCGGGEGRFEWGRSWAWAPVGSNQTRLKLATNKAICFKTNKQLQCIRAKCTFLLDSFDIRSYIHLKSEKIKKKYENEQRKSEHHTLPISQLSHRKTESPRIDMTLHSDTLFWFHANQSLFLFLSAVSLAEKQQIPNGARRKRGVRVNTLTLMEVQKVVK